MEEHKCLLEGKSVCRASSECMTCGWSSREHEKRIRQIRAGINLAWRRVMIPGRARTKKLMTLRVHKVRPDLKSK